ncbi:MAG: hypothetical protein A2Y77_06765 [Planctomycetes bacterium RBG_13_62_9]|nr:MAG: hypothetical protein A2Y77_06765 [Planctomycetes bacterium RBG_13_62_9]
MSHRFPVEDWSLWAIGNDVTEYRWAQKELHEYHESMRHAERLASLAMVSATLAHELTQPLSVVRLAAQNALAELEKLNCPDVIRQDLQAGLAACSQIAAIVSRFRDVARQPARAKEIDVCIDQVADKTIRLLERSARQARVRLQTENLQTLSAIRMRENELDQVFFALAQNAIQAADGDKDCCLRITGTQHENQIVLQFQDDCRGIEPDNLPKIFDPFFTTKPPGTGMGLGLCIVRRIVRQRGGEISVRSARGEGATFTVTLPRRGGDPCPR